MQTKKKATKAAPTTTSGFPTPEAPREAPVESAPPPATSPDLASEIRALAAKVKGANLNDGAKRNAAHRLEQAAAEIA